MRTKRIFAVITAAIVISCGIGLTNAEAAGLKLKQSGSEVKALQLELITLGYLDNAHPTGYYGEATKKAVASFQKDNGLKADGIAGSKTTSAIKKKLIKPDIIRRGFRPSAAACKKRLSCKLQRFGSIRRGNPECGKKISGGQ